MKKTSPSQAQAFKLRRGSEIVGKWHKKTYRIMKELGSGATGTVYLAEEHDRYVALKVGADPFSIGAEVNVLKHLAKIEGQVLGPSLLDVDDFDWLGKVTPFYAMEYLNGKGLFHFIRERGSEWLGIFIVQLLGDLDRLHRAGWVFGDLKPDNLMIIGPPPRIRWFDVGGTTLIGRSVKEFTEFYDRGYWGLGTRKAEPSYDLFSVVMIMLNCYYPHRFNRHATERPLVQLREAIEQQEDLKRFRSVMLRALQGKYDDAQAMRKDVIAAIEKVPSKRDVKLKRSEVHTKRRKKKRKSKKASYLVEIILIVAFFLLLYILYLYGQLS